MTETALAKLEMAERVLANAKDIREVLNVRSASVAVQAFARAQGDNELWEKAMRTKLWAERKAGKFLEEMPKSKGAAEKRGDNMSLRLHDIRVSRQESSRWQRIHRLPRKLFEQLLADSTRISQAALLHHEMRLRTAANGERDPPEAPEGRFNVILADPPWPNKAAIAGEVERHYTTLSPEEIAKRIPPSSDDAVLFLWTVNVSLEEALWVMEQWGFSYVTNLVWVKDRFGTGYYFRGQHELLLLGKKGNIRAPAESNRPSSVLHSKRLAHSQKPAEVYDLIERMYPGCKYLELYGRGRARSGWKIWGLEAIAS